MSKKEIDNLYHYWRKTLRKQLGFTGHLFLVFSVTVLGYTVKFLIEHHQIYLFIAFILLLISIAFGVWFSINRLRDFRKTARLYGEGKGIKKVMAETDCIGKITWGLFIAQIITFGLGFIFDFIGFIEFYLW